METVWLNPPTPIKVSSGISKINKVKRIPIGLNQGPGLSELQKKTLYEQRKWTQTWQFVALTDYPLRTTLIQPSLFTIFDPKDDFYYFIYKSTTEIWAFQD